MTLKQKAKRLHQGDPSSEKTFITSLTIYVANFGVFAKIAAAILFAQMILPVLGLFYGASFWFLLTSASNSWEGSGSPDPASFGLMTLALSSTAVLGTIAAGSTIRATAEIFAGHKPCPINCLKKAVSKALPLTVAGTLYTLGALLGLLCLFLPGFYLLITLSFFAPAIMVEDEIGVIESLNRSKDLVAGRWPYALCVIVLVGLTIFALAQTVPEFLASLLVTQFSSVVWTTMYIELRSDKGLD